MANRHHDHHDVHGRYGHGTTMTGHHRSMTWAQDENARAWLGNLEPQIATDGDGDDW